MTYATPHSFRTSLEDRLRNVTKGPLLVRRRQLLVFDRLLARLSKKLGDAVILKGGLVLELRLERARTTKDVDLRLTGNPDNVLEVLREAGRLDLGDFMEFLVSADSRHPTIQGDGVQYEGFRFRAECRIAGQLYGQAFGVDVAFGDPLVGEPDLVTAPNTLGFAGVEPPTLRLYPLVTHIAEKLHAYTLPRERPNTRLKDLPDIALLATAQPIQAAELYEAFEKTFAFRGTHPLPLSLPKSPEAWAPKYLLMAQQEELQWSDIEILIDAIEQFLNPVLAGELEKKQWSPSSWTWN